MLNEMLNEVKAMQERISELEEKNKQLVLEQAEMLNAMKSKFSDDKFTLVSNDELMESMQRIENISCEASSLESDICELEYSEVGSVSSYIEDCSYAASAIREQCDDVFETLQEMQIEEEEKEEAEPTPKKAPAKKKMKAEDLDVHKQIFGDNA